MTSIMDMHKLRDVDVSELREVAKEARLAFDQAMPEKPSGCGRAYVTFLGRTLKKHVQVLESAGFMVCSAPGHGNDKVIYIGYDNHDGLPQGQARAVADVFQKHDIFAGVDLQGD